MTEWWYWLLFCAVAIVYSRIIWLLIRQSRWSERQLELRTVAMDRLMEDVCWRYLRREDYVLALTLRAERLRRQQPVPLKLVEAVRD